MEHLAIDLGGRESQACVRDSEGRIVEERRLRTADLERYLAGRPPSRVIVETCTEAFPIADVALRLSHEVRVVPASLVRTLGVGSRQVKNDRRDAQILSEVSARVDLPSVHVPSDEARHRKQLCRVRETMVRSRTRLVNSVRAWLRTMPGRNLRPGNVMRISTRLNELVGDSEIPQYVQRALSAIDCLNEQIAEATYELEQIAANDDLCRRLMTVPGVGPVVSIRFAAALDDARRFPDAHKVESYFGLVPGEKSSSERHHTLGLTKAGSPQVRWALTQAAWSVWRGRRRNITPLHRWMIEVEKRRGKHVAISATARKLAGILFAIARDGTEYSAQRAADL